MTDFQPFSTSQLAGFLLVSSTVVMFPGLIMFWVRAGHKGGKPLTQRLYLIERGFIFAAVIVAAVGFILLFEANQNPTGRGLALLGATGYLFGSVLVVTGEALGLSIGYEKTSYLENIYVFCAFLSQAVIGWAFLQSGLVAAWIGWLSIAWNLVWLIAIPLLSPHDLYFPVLHTITPLLVGIALLLQ